MNEGFDLSKNDHKLLYIDFDPSAVRFGKYNGKCSCGWIGLGKSKIAVRKEFDKHVKRA